MNRKESPWTAVTVADQWIGGSSGSVGACVAAGKGRGREAWVVHHPATALPARLARGNSVVWEVGHVIRFDHWTRARALQSGLTRLWRRRVLVSGRGNLWRGFVLVSLPHRADGRRVTWGLGLLHAGMRCITFCGHDFLVARRVVLCDWLNETPLAA
jgi:hypothetical protein